MFLTADEIKDLTGYQQFFKQIVWLKIRGWRYEISRTGRPIVLAKHAEEMLMVGTPAVSTPKMNLAAIKKAA